MVWTKASHTQATKARELFPICRGSIPKCVAKILRVQSGWVECKCDVKRSPESLFHAPRATAFDGGARPCVGVRRDRGRCRARRDAGRQRTGLSLDPRHGTLSARRIAGHAMRALRRPRMVRMAPL